MEAQAFLERVLKHLPPAAPSAYAFTHWSHDGRPTDEGLGLLPVPGLDPEAALAAVMDVDRYAGNLDHVVECRSKADPRFEPPDAVRFYQRLEIPMIGAIQHELALQRLGTHAGYQCAGWDILRPETDALSPKAGFRSDYNHGVWLAAPGLLGYALGSAPKRKDVGFLKWKALTSGADAAASRVIKANIQAMARWADRR